jgi:hypothetical protein
MAELKKVYHVLPNKGGGWLVKEHAAKNPSAKYDSKPEAVTRAKELGLKAKAKVVVHKKDGSIERQFPYSAPAPAKPVAKAAVKPAKKPVAKPAPKVMPKMNSRCKPKVAMAAATKAVAKPVAKAVAKPAARKAVKPAAKKKK